MRRLFALLALALSLASCRVGTASGPRVLLIGLDGVSWDQLTAMIRAGEIPHFARLCDGGAWGTLESESPVTPSGFWVAAASGRPPSEHRVVAPIRYEPAATALIAPERAVSMVWEIAARRRVPAGVIGWPGSVPTPPGLAAGVDELAFYRGLGLATELTGASLPTPPYDGARTDFVGRVPRGGELAARLAAASRAQAPTLAAQVWARVQLLAVFLDGVNGARHYAGAARALGDPLTAPEFGKLSRRYVRELNAALGSLLALADPQTLTIVVADDPSYTPGQSSDGWFAHPTHGLVALLGPGVAAGRKLEKASVLDVTPAALRHLGIPLSAQMADQPFREAWKGAFPTTAKVASHDAFVRRPYPAEAPLRRPEIQARAAAVSKAATAGEGPFNERNLYALEMLAEGKLQGALSEARRDLGERDNPVSRYVIGEARLAQDKTEEARRHYEEAAHGLADQPAGPGVDALRTVAGMALARAALALNDPQAAATALEPALAACPDCLEAATLAARSWLTLDQPGKAAKLIGPALRAHPKDATLWRLLGDARRLTGDRQGARDAYRQALRRSKDPPREALRELGLLALAEGSWSEAAKRLGMLTRLTPDDADAWLQLARALQGLGKGGKAREALRACLRVDPTVVEAWSEWRKIAAAEGDGAQAARLLAAARSAVAAQRLAGAAATGE